MAAHDGGDGSTGSARRRRERRLRSWLRHEQQSIAAVLATVTHHSFGKVGTVSGVLRNLRTATRTREGLNEKIYTATVQENPPPTVPGTQYFTMTPNDDLSVPEHDGGRPAPRPQARDRRHTGVGFEIVLAPVLPPLGFQEAEKTVSAFLEERILVTADDMAALRQEEEEEEEAARNIIFLILPPEWRSGPGHHVRVRGGPER